MGAVVRVANKRDLCTADRSTDLVHCLFQQRYNKWTPGSGSRPLRCWTRFINRAAASALSFRAYYLVDRLQIPRGKLEPSRYLLSSYSGK